MTATQTSVSKALDTLIPTNTTKLAIAVSGGADSMALTLLCQNWAQKKPIEIHSLTVDHKLREESTGETKQVQDWLKRYQINHQILTWQHQQQLKNIQQDARNARYQLMCNYCIEHDIPILLTAHTLEDQAETVLLRLMRGSGVDGLSAMKETTTCERVSIIRPLLIIKKNQLTTFLKQQKQQWIEDPSNYNDKFERVNMRNFLNNSKDKELLIERLAKTASNMAQTRSYLEQQTNTAIEECSTWNDMGFSTIDSKNFNNLHTEIGLRVLNHLLCKVSGSECKPRHNKLNNLYYNIISNKISTKHTLNGCLITKKNNTITISREISAISQDLPLQENTTILWDNRFIIKLTGCNTMPIHIGVPTASELKNIQPELGKKLPPKHIINTIPALKMQGNIIAIPHLNYFTDKNQASNCKIKYKKIQHFPVAWELPVL